MIVRDEAAFLEECLSSISEVVDEIVIVDTGSTDGSKRIARAFHARLFDFAWCDDFSVARNEALARATGEWLLYIDADERLRPAARSSIDALLADDSAVAHTVLFRPQSGYTRYREYRVFRNDPRIRFHGAIHETMLPALHAVAAHDGRRIGHSTLAIDHVGYDGDQQRKHRRNLPLLRARLEREPDHVFSWHHLGRTLAAMGDSVGAGSAWRQGIQAVRRRTESSPADSLVYSSLLRQELDRARLDAELLDEALARFPGNHVLAWLRGRALIAARRFEEAIGVFARLAAVNAEMYVDDAVAYDARIFGPWALDALGLCCFRLDRFAESARYYALAEAAAPDSPAYGFKRRLAEARCAHAR
jgi:tetratricopeptide (TPR) repeat protein